MPILETTTLTNQNISASLMTGSWTATRATSVFARLFAASLVGNESYIAFATMQRAGTGYIYRSGETSASIPTGTSHVFLSTIEVPISNTDIFKTYIIGASTDTASANLITEIWEGGMVGACAIAASSIGGSAFDATVFKTGAITRGVLGASALAASNIGGSGFDSTVFKSGAFGVGVFAASALGASNIGGSAFDSSLFKTGAIPLGVLGACVLSASNLATGAISVGVIGASAMAASNIGGSSFDSTVFKANAIPVGILGASALAASNIAENAITTTLGASAISASNVATGALRVGTLGACALSASNLADGAITATATLGSSAISASNLATDATNLLADTTWDELRTGHTVGSSFGEGVATVQGNVTGTIGGLGASAISASNIATGAIRVGVLGASAIGASNLAGSTLNAATYDDDVSTSTGSGVWSYATRALTQTAAQVQSVMQGSNIIIKRGDSLSAAITGMGDISSRTKLYFTVKKNQDDVDTDAIIQILKSNPADGTADGLLYINGVAGTKANGSITIDNATSGNITVALDEVETAKLRVWKTLFYDVQMITATAVQTMTEASAEVTDDVTRATS